jgi:hypothetical protein
MKRVTNFSMLLVVALVSTTLAFQENQQEKNRIVIPHDDENTIARRDFMRSKLLYAQNIFAGLTAGDFMRIKAGIKEVQGITEGEKWVAIDNDLYRKLTEDFKTTTQRLSDAAESGNLEAVALRYYQMSTSCIDCHKHIREAAYQF